MRLTSIAKSILFTSLIVSTSAFAAHHNYKDGGFKDKVFKDQPSCPDIYSLKDGFYIGAQAGYDNYRDHEKNVTSAPSYTTYSNTLSANGWLGGLFAGYGRFVSDVYYVGGEVFGNLSSNAKTQNIVTVDPTTTPLTVMNTRLTGRSSYGASFLPGIKVNDASLVYVRLGYRWTSLRYQAWLNGNGSNYASKSTTEGGFNYGVGIETLLYQNWSMRGEYTHTSYGSFNNTIPLFNPGSSASSNVNPSDNLFTLGLNYHFA
jgi:opacity protein-like surface antigen